MFKVGDKVKILSSQENVIPAKTKGIILRFERGSDLRYIGVEFRKAYSGAHSMGCRVPEGHGYYFTDSEIKLIIDTHICGLICKCNAKEAIRF